MHILFVCSSLVVAHLSLFHRFLLSFAAAVLFFDRQKPAMQELLPHRQTMQELLPHRQATQELLPRRPKARRKQ